MENPTAEIDLVDHPGTGLIKSTIDTLCIILPIAFFVAPATVFYPAFANNTKLEVPPLAFTAQALQSFIWFLFGTGLANYGDRVVVYIPNAIGFITGVLWVALYPFFMRAKTIDRPQDYGKEWLQQSVGAVVLGVIFMVALGTATWGSPDYVLITESMGYFAMTVGTFMMWSPAFVMVSVLETGNVAAMGSLVMNIVTLLCGGAWWINGYFYMGKPQVWIQNGIGFMVGWMALTIRVYVANTPKFYALDREERLGKKRSPLDGVIGGRRAADAEMGAISESPNNSEKDGNEADSQSLMK